MLPPAEAIQALSPNKLHHCTSIYERNKNMRQRAGGCASECTRRGDSAIVGTSIIDARLTGGLCYQNPMLWPQQSEIRLKLNVLRHSVQADQAVFKRIYCKSCKSALSRLLFDE